MRSNNRKGFSAIEGLVVSVIGAIVIGVVAGVYFGGRAIYRAVTTPEVERANVRGEPETELFITEDEDRAYAEIDGRPIKEYLEQKL